MNTSGYWDHVYGEAPAPPDLPADVVVEAFVLADFNRNGSNRHLRGCDTTRATAPAIWSRAVDDDTEYDPHVTAVIVCDHGRVTHSVSAESMAELLEQISQFSCA